MWNGIRNWSISCRKLSTAITVPISTHPCGHPLTLPTTPTKLKKNNTCMHAHTLSNRHPITQLHSLLNRLSLSLIHTRIRNYMITQSCTHAQNIQTCTHSHTHMHVRMRARTQTYTHAWSNTFSCKHTKVHSTKKTEVSEQLGQTRREDIHYIGHTNSL